MTQALGSGRVLLGFAGAAGVREGALVRYMHSKRNNTYVGELDGRRTPRLDSICEAFAETRFPVKVIDHIDAWLKTHVAVISPLAYGLYMCGGDNYRMARTRDAQVLTVRAVREGLRALMRLDHAIEPRMLEWIFGLPEPVVVAFLRLLLNTQHAEIGIAGHANAARDEMQHLADDFWKLVQLSGEPAPSLRSLYAYANPIQPPITDGSQRLAIGWGELWLSLGALVVELLLLTWLVRRLAWKMKRRKEK
jgi:2-dehydropantoate 2-reductase